MNSVQCAVFLKIPLGPSDSCSSYRQLLLGHPSINTPQSEIMNNCIWSSYSIDLLKCECSVVSDIALALCHRGIPSNGHPASHDQQSLTQTTLCLECPCSPPAIISPTRSPVRQRSTNHATSELSQAHAAASEETGTFTKPPLFQGIGSLAEHNQHL